MSSLAELTLFSNARAFADRFGDRAAVIDQDGAHTYADLLAASANVASALLAGRGDLREARVAFLVPPSFEYVATQSGIWRAGGIAVPLATSHPPPELAYVIDDAQASIVVAHPQFEATLRPIAEERGLHFLVTTDDCFGPVPSHLEGEGEDEGEANQLGNASPLTQPSPFKGEGQPTLPAVDPSRQAMILYTSGTTGKPKGVVTTHANIEAQVTALADAWGWTADDHILHVLPLHHIHGIVNALSCAMWAGATCEFMPRFDADAVWQRFVDGGPTLFMAVPTIYARLVSAWEQAPPARQRELSEAAARLRLMVSGSSALPVPVLERWREITGHTLLERYGMTEIGMALSNPLEGERRAGCVGTPLPGTEVRVVDEDGRDVPDGAPGELLVRGPSVFLEYWNRPEATREAFVDGWFRTGDVVAVERGVYRILGRNSVDIIKTGGYKVSALEIENVLLEHPAISECAVVGVEDAEWGERVCAAVVTRDGDDLALDALRDWAKECLAPYKVPSRLACVAELPRNAMGKVLKPEVAKRF